MTSHIAQQHLRVFSRAIANRILATVGTMLCCATSPAFSQDRTDDNAITQAEDGFGLTVGRESIGIYTSTSTRGFSPTAAGNVRIDGLYFDPRAPLASTIYDTSSIKVGLSAQGYPFTAPSGIVDYNLRRPRDTWATSVVINADAFGSTGVEIDGSVPVSSTLALGYGLAANRNQFYDGTSDWTHSETLVARWHPSANVEVMPVWMLSNDYDNEASPIYVPAGNFLPPRLPTRSFNGPTWDDFRNIGSNAGVIASVVPARNWMIRIGAFRSVFQQITSFTNLLQNLQPDGTADQVILADPPTHNVSLSGEARITHSILEGPRHHLFYLSVRERDARREFGGSDVVDLGMTRIGAPVEVPEPAFVFGQVSKTHVRQTTYGFAYDGRWKNVGELSFGLSRAAYEKTTALPDVAPVVTRSRPWLYNGTLAIDVLRAVTFYAGYSRGLEESGVAPANATNRNEPLATILTEQKDGGARWTIGKLKATLGAFELKRPYFSLGNAGRYYQTGTTRARGAEFSLSGPLTDRLDVVAAGVVLHARVEHDGLAGDGIGARPVGLADNTLSFNVNWRVPAIVGLSLDGNVAHRGNVIGTTDNLVTIPPRDQISLGGHYRFKLSGHNATLRVQLANLLDNRVIASVGPGLYTANPGRSLSGYLAMDF